MTEQEWLSSPNPLPMLHALRFQLRTSDRNKRLYAADRIFRLFAVACCQSILNQTRRLELRQVLERRIDLSTRAAEGLVSQQELTAEGEHIPFGSEECAANALCDADAHLSAWNVAKFTSDISLDAWMSAHPGTRRRSKEANAVIRNQGKLQSDYLRCIVGNPFSTLMVQSSWKLWNESTPLRIARSIHDERVFEQLPILADALEDAGCDNADILEHCRGPGPHVRGCWVLDLLLDKS